MTKIAVDYKGIIGGARYTTLATIENTLTCDLPDDVADEVVKSTRAHGAIDLLPAVLNIEDAAKAFTNLYFMGHLL